LLTKGSPQYLVSTLLGLASSIFCIFPFYPPIDRTCRQGFILMYCSSSFSFDVSSLLLPLPAPCSNVSVYLPPCGYDVRIVSGLFPSHFFPRVSPSHFFFVLVSVFFMTWWSLCLLLFVTPNWALYFLVSGFFCACGDGISSPSFLRGLAFCIFSCFLVRFSFLCRLISHVLAV